jgi:hypothetical protein
MRARVRIHSTISDHLFEHIRTRRSQRKEGRMSSTSRCTIKKGKRGRKKK